MIISTTRVEDLIEASHDPRLFMELYQFINQITGGEGVLYKQYDDAMTIIGYYIVPYKTNSFDGEYPLISIAPQKNNISIYVMVTINGEYLVPLYGDAFGKSNVGKSCIRIKKMNEEKYDALEGLLQRAISTFNKS